MPQGVTSGYPKHRLRLPREGKLIIPETFKLFPDISLPARVRRVAPVLPGPPDPRREVPHDAAGRKGSNLWDEAARGVAGALWSDPPPGAADGRAVPDPVGGSTGQGATMRHTQRAGDEPLSQLGEAV